MAILAKFDTMRRRRSSLQAAHRHPRIRPKTSTTGIPRRRRGHPRGHGISAHKDYLHHKIPFFDHVLKSFVSRLSDRKSERLERARSREKGSSRLFLYNWRDSDDPEGHAQPARIPPPENRPRKFP